VTINCVAPSGILSSRFMQSPGYRTLCLESENVRLIGCFWNIREAYYQRAPMSMPFSLRQSFLAFPMHVGSKSAWCYDLTEPHVHKRFTRANSHLSTDHKNHFAHARKKVPMTHTWLSLSHDHFPDVTKKVCTAPSPWLVRFMMAAPQICDLSLCILCALCGGYD
jgi:hypothetical protein